DRIAELRANPQRKGDAAMIRSIFTRDGHPNLYDPAMVEALIASEMQNGDSVPSGTYVDMAVNLPLVDPTKVLSPVLMTRGEWDGNSTDDDLLEFFRQLPNGNRQYVILPNTAHNQVFSKNRQLLWYAMKNFLVARAGGGSKENRRRPGVRASGGAPPSGCRPRAPPPRKIHAAHDKFPPALRPKGNVRRAAPWRCECRSHSAARYLPACDCGRRRRSRPTITAPGSRSSARLRNPWCPCRDRRHSWRDNPRTWRERARDCGNSACIRRAPADRRSSGPAQFWRASSR